MRSDLGASGVAFSLDTESGFRDAVVINGSFGLGEMIVQGAVSPDEFIVFKPGLKKGLQSIIEKKLGVKDKMMVYGDKPDERVRIISTEKGFQQRFCIHDEQVVQLAQWVVAIEEYYSRLKAKWTPMDVEWAVDGLSKELFMCRRGRNDPFPKDHALITEYSINDNDRAAKVLVEGIAVGDKIAGGKVNILYSMDKRVIDGHEFMEGDVLVTDMTDPDWEPIMKKLPPSLPTRRAYLSRGHCSKELGCLRSWDAEMQRIYCRKGISLR